MLSAARNAISREAPIVWVGWTPHRMNLALKEHPERVEAMLEDVTTRAANRRGQRSSPVCRPFSPPPYPGHRLPALCPGGCRRRLMVPWAVPTGLALLSFDFYAVY